MRFGAPRRRNRHRRSGGRRHHLAALWPVELAAELSRALRIEGVRKVESFAARYRLAVAEWPSEPVDPFFNVNAPGDLEAAEVMLRPPLERQRPLV